MSQSWLNGFVQRESILLRLFDETPRVKKS
jgi:hypothetical protein